MKHLLICLILVLFGTNSFAASGSGNISNVVTLGGISTTDGLNINEANSQGYFTVYVGGGMTAGNFSPFYKDGTAYQVTAGKTFQIVKYCIFSDTTVSKAQLLTSTATIAFNTNSALTGPKYQGGATTQYAFTGAVTTFSPTCFSQTFSAAASTYLGIQAGTTAAYYVQALGKEIP